MLYVIMSLYAKDTLLKVQEAAESLLSQTYISFYLYIIYDSPIGDGVASYVTSLLMKQICINTREKNPGLAYLLNELLDVVLKKEDCTYTARMDADDISMPRRFVGQIAFIDSHSDADCLGTWAIEIDNGGKRYFRKKILTAHKEYLELFKERDRMVHPTVILWHSYFEKASLYPENTYSRKDTMVWTKGFRSGCKFANVPKYLFKFRLDLNFFKRGRGQKHTRSIYTLRRRINRVLGFERKRDCYVLLYAMAKLIPKSVFDIIYKTVR